MGLYLKDYRRAIIFLCTSSCDLDSTGLTFGWRREQYAELRSDIEISQSHYAHWLLNHHVGLSLDSNCDVQRRRATGVFQHHWDADQRILIFGGTVLQLELLRIRPADHER